MEFSYCSFSLYKVVTFSYDRDERVHSWSCSFYLTYTLIDLKSESQYVYAVKPHTNTWFCWMQQINVQYDALGCKEDIFKLNIPNSVETSRNVLIYFD